MVRMAAVGSGREGGLAPFVSDLAARWVIEHPDERHRRLPGTLVSADLSGFTALSERLAERGKRGAEDLTAMVNGCFTSLIRTAAVEGGDVLKFGGDALLVWFEGDGHQWRAVRAAARMQRAIGASRFSRAGLTMSVGAHTGHFDVFLVGRPDWRELVLAGPPVSTTVVLEAAARAGEVLVSRSLAASLPTAWLGAKRVDGTSIRLEAIDGLDARRRSRPRPAVEVGAAARLVAPSLQAHIAALAGVSGEHRLATVVFAELEGSDTSVDTDLASFADSVDSLVNAVEELADRYGVLFLYTDVIADGVKLIAVAGSPTSTGEDEEAGLRFATDLVADDPRQKLRCGVNRGRVFAGFLGSEDRRTYTVMGDPVNLSARLMARAGSGEVLASEDVIASSGAQFSSAPVPAFLVKGRRQPVTAHRVGRPTGGRRSRAGRRLPLVGREAELAQLEAAVGDAAAGRGAVVEIVGDAGIGKTRLIEAVAQDPRVAVRVATECQPYDVLSPFAAIRPLLRRALGIPVEASPSEAGVALEGIIARAARELGPLAPLIAVPVGGEVAPTEVSESIDEQFRSARMHDAVVALLGAVLMTPTMLVVEDIYYVDDASLQLLRAVASNTPGKPWVVLVTRRPEGAGVVVGPVDGILLKVSPLLAEEARRLVEDAIGRPDLAGVDVSHIADRSGGNPLFVLELAGGASLGYLQDDLPESIERLVAARLDRLPPDDRTILRMAAVVGRLFHTGLVNTLLAIEGRSPVSSDRWALLEDFVEVDAGRRFRFRHALFRDVAYEGLPYARRRRIHRSVGDLYEAGVAGEPEAAVLSLHYWLGGDAARTWDYSVAAGDAAWRSLAVSEAAEAYRRALNVRRRLPRLDSAEIRRVAEALGDAQERLARYDESLESYRLAARVGATNASIHRTRLLRKQGVLHQRSGRYGPALRTLLGALRREEAGARPDRRECAELRLALSATRHRQGRHREMLSWARQAEADASDASDDRLVGMANDLMQVATTHGAGTPTTAFGERAVELFRQTGEVRSEGFALLNLGVEDQLRGRWTSAATRYRASLAALDKAGDRSFSAVATNNLAEILSDQGAWPQALDLFHEALREWRGSGYGIGVAVGMLNLGRTLGRLGDIESACRELDDATALFEHLGARSYVSESLIRRAEVHLYAGESADALALADRCLADETTVELFPYTCAAAWRVRGWAAMQQQRVADAVAAFLTAEGIARDHGSAYDVALALVGRAASSGAESPGLEAAELLSSLGVTRVAEVPLLV